jgi:hypothetical protein
MIPGTVYISQRKRWWPKKDLVEPSLWRRRTSLQLDLVLGQIRPRRIRLCAKRNSTSPRSRESKFQLGYCVLPTGGRSTFMAKKSHGCDVELDFGADPSPTQVIADRQKCRRPERRAEPEDPGPDWPLGSSPPASPSSGPGLTPPLATASSDTRPQVQHVKFLLVDTEIVDWL